MSIDSQKNIPLKGMNLEVDELNIPENMVRFIKGWSMMLNKNSSTDMDGGFEQGANVFVRTKDQSNESFGNINLAAGVNKSIRGGYVQETGMYYSCIWNSLGNHSIWQLDANNRTITKVIQNSCLGFVYDPVHFISNTRFAAFPYTVVNKVTGLTEQRTWIAITDNNSRTKQIQVEDCIATNGLTHSFFTTETDCCNVCDMITMGFPSIPNDCIDISPVVRPDTEEEKAKSNSINFNTWQFRLRHIDAWGRSSFHGVISKQYFNSKATACTNEDTFPRCLDLGFDAGCPVISCIVLEYSNCNGLTKESDWKEYDTICKYSDCDANDNYIQDFWERPIVPAYYLPVSDTNGINYDPVTNRITYRFCGNKECKSIPVEETSLSNNYIANKSNSVFKIGNKVGTANNERGFNPLDCGEKKKIITEINGDESCNPFEYRKVTIWAYIYSPLDNEVTNIRYIEKTNGAQKNTVAYGRIGRDDGTFSATKGNPTYYNQIMDGVDGFVMSAKGHDDLFCVSKQYDISAGKDNAVLIGVSQYKSNDKNTIQRFDFYVPAGKYVFELHNPMAGLRNSNSLLAFISGNYKDTSGDMIGLTDINNIGSLVSEQYELYIDCCNGDVEIFENPVMIWDLTRDVQDDVVNNYPNIVKGHAVDTNGVGNQLIVAGKYGVEGAVVVDIISATTAHFSKKTDSRGHFFMTSKGSGFGNQLQGLITSTGCISQAKNTAISTVLNEFIDTFVYFNLETFQIRGQYRSCEPINTPIAGQVIAYQNGGYTKTDNDGNFIIYAHGAPASRADDKLLIANSVGGCLRVNCDDDCDSCFDLIDITPPPCGDSRILDLGIARLKNLDNVFQRGLMEGKYGVGFVLSDCAVGAETFVQANDDNYVEVVNLEQVNQISFDITGINIPSNFKWLHWYVTENLTYEDWMEWVIDYAILEDNNGNIGNGTNIANPARMRIYIESLVNYTAYGNTNTSWQFLKGDLLKIFSLGNGDVENITKLVSYKEGDNYITIDYDENSMKIAFANATGSRIRLLRPRTCQTSEVYFQICKRIRITNGEPDELTGVIDYSNMFKIQRSVPVYTNVINTQQVVENIYDTQGKVVSTKTVDKPYSTPTSINQKKTYIMNHHSPSDFFGDHCWGRGRVNVKNPFEKTHRISTEISIGGGISSEGNTDYLHWFKKSDSISSIDEQTYNSITGVICQQNLLLAICPTDSFVLLYNQNEFRVVDGRVLSNVADDKFGKPRSKIGDEYGCQQFDINTIFYRNGEVGFVDSRRGCIVRHNFDAAEDATPFGLKGWLVEKIKENLNNNLSGDSDAGIKYLHGIICPKTKKYILTSFLTNSSSLNYVNNLPEIDLPSTETVVIDFSEKLFEYMLHTTPEMWGYVESGFMGAQLMAFNNGVPYIQYPLLEGGDNYLNFFGIQCKPVIEPVFNKGNTIDKNFLWLEAKLKQHQLYSDRVMTESGQISRIMPKWWNRVNNAWNAPFMCQTNSVNDPNLPSHTGDMAIVDSETLFGKWVKVRLVTKDEDDSKYAELNSITLFFSNLGK